MLSGYTRNKQRAKHRLLLKYARQGDEVRFDRIWRTLPDFKSQAFLYLTFYTCGYMLLAWREIFETPWLPLSTQEDLIASATADSRFFARRLNPEVVRAAVTRSNMRGNAGKIGPKYPNEQLCLASLAITVLAIERWPPGIVERDTFRKYKPALDRKALQLVNTT